jgi:phosphoadenosine phosphosulfate reductase
LPVFKGRLARTLEAIASAAEKGRIGVSYSGGKDSTVLLDITRLVVPDVLAGFFDSGCEYPWTYEMMPLYDVLTITPVMSLLEMCRYGGYWGYATPTDPDATFNFTEALIYEPSRRFVAEQSLAVVSMGLRADESYGRLMSAKSKGLLYWVKSSSVWHFCPLAHWKTEDVWAYIASRELPYNVAYDRMAEAGIPRENWRVSTLMGVVGAATQGRYTCLRIIDPASWRSLSAEFPKIARYT